MTTPCVTLNDGATGFQGGTATTDLIDILDTVDVPIVVLRRDFMLVCFNKAAAGVLRLSASDIGRASRDISVLAGLPRLEEQCGQVIASGVESRADFRDGERSEEHTSELQSPCNLVCRLLLEKKKKK